MTNEWGGKHGFYPLVLSEAKMRLVDGNNNLDCKRIDKNKLLNPRITDSTKRYNLLQLQEYHKVEWQEYTLQEVFDSMTVKAIVAAVDSQYVD